jgi:hypothetical protein
MPKQVKNFEIGKLRFKKIVRFPSDKNEFIYEGKVYKGWRKIGWFHGDAKNFTQFKANVKKLDFYVNEKRANRTINKKDLK